MRPRTWLIGKNGTMLQYQTEELEKKLKKKTAGKNSSSETVRSTIRRTPILAHDLFVVTCQQRQFRKFNDKQLY